MGRHYYDDWQPYVPVAKRRRNAAKKIAKMKKAGHNVAPVEIQGRKIAATFWGDAWCKNLEAYSDYANRLPRGRTYVRNGSVIDLQIEKGKVRALVSGSFIYEIEITIKPLAKKRWIDVKKRCAGQIDSLIELLQGAVSKGVMEIVTRKGEGLFPEPAEIQFNCSCPDWATMCKHVAATLYGVGARLDHEPELLFLLRGVDPTEMVAAAVDQPTTGNKAPKGRLLETESLSSVFGVDIDKGGATPDEPPAPVKPAGGTKPTLQKSRKKSAKLPTPREKDATKKPTARKQPAKSAAATHAPKKTSARKTPATKARAGQEKKSAITSEALERLHERSVKFVENSPVLRQLVTNVQLTRGRLYLWRTPANLLARITPTTPRSMSLETSRRKSWIEHKRGQLATVLKHLENDPEGTLHGAGAQKEPERRG